MKFLSLIFSLCVFSLCQAQDWTPIDIGTQEDLNKIYFIDDTNGFIIGDNGTLFKTTDGGSNWVNISTGASHDLVTMSFVDQNIGFVNGLKTTDGGDSWTIQSATELFALIKGFDAENLIGGNGFIFDGAVYKSTDGGLTWQVISDPIDTGFYTDEYFVNDNIGYMTSWYSGHLIKTEDGGENWTEITSISQTTAFSDYNGVTFPSLNIGIVASNAHIVKTTDGGANWSSIYSIIDNNILFNSRGIFSTSENNYIVVGGSLSNSIETIYETTDGGLTWTLTNNSVHLLENITCTTSNCYAVGQNGTVLTKGNATVATNNPIQFSKEITLHPNPTENYLQINSGEADVEWIEVIDLYGKVHGKHSLDGNSVFVGNLPKGFYLLKIKLEQSESILKFEKI